MKMLKKFSQKLKNQIHMKNIQKIAFVAMRQLVAWFLGGT